MGQSNPEDLGNGGTIDGDIVITGDLQVNGGGSLSFDEIVQGTQVIDVTNTEALLVRKNDDGGDVFIVDTTNSGVGVNTSAGGWGLNVKGADANVFKVQASDGNTLSFLQGTNGDATQKWFADGNVTKVLINTNGDSYFTGGSLGIGTASPAEKLHLKGDGYRLEISSADYDILKIGAYGDSGGDADNGFLNLLNDGSEKIRLLADGTSYFNGGNVGIGTDSPTSLMHIQSNDSTTNAEVDMLTLQALSTGTTTTGFGGAIKFQAERNNGVSQNVGKIRSIAEVNSGNNISSGLSFETGTFGTLNESMRITYDGKVGIGTDSPASSIHAKSSASTLGTLERSTSGNVVLEWKNTGDSWYAGIDSSQHFKISQNGDIASGTEFKLEDETGNATFGGNVKITKAESSASEFISALEINRDYGSATATDLLTGMIFTDDNSVQAGIFTNRYNSAGSYNSRLQFYVNNSSSSMTPQTALGDPALIIDESKNATFAGDVAIGSAIASYTDAISTSQTLSVGENQDSSDKLASVQIIGRGSNSTDTLGALEFINTRSGTGVVSSIVGGRFSGGSASDGSLSFNTKNGSSLTTKMTINDVGNVGIGIASPLQKLHVSGHALLGVDTGANIYFTDADGTADEMMIGYDKANTRIRFRSNAHSADRMVVTKTGNVGIGVDAPSSKLHVKETAGDEFFTFANGNGIGLVNNVASHGIGISASQSGSYGGQGSSALIVTEGGGSANAGTVQMVHDGTVGFTYKGGNVGIGIVPVATFQVKTASDVNFTLSANSGDLRINAVNDAVDSAVGLEFNGADYEFLGTGTSTFGGNVRLPNSGKLYLWNDHSSNYLSYNNWQASVSSGMTIANTSGSGSIILKSGNSTALTLDSSQNATFAGDITVPSDIIHAGDTDNKIKFEANKVTLSNTVGTIVSTPTSGGISSLYVTAIHPGNTDVYKIGGMQAQIPTSAWLSANVKLLGPALTGYGTGIEYLKFETDGTNKFSTFSSVVNANSGINFPDSQVASSDANTLDDYEEGTWTPVIEFGGNAVDVAYGTQVGKYTKIGNTVFIEARLVLTNNGSSTGTALILGLPFTHSSTATTISLGIRTGVTQERNSWAMVAANGTWMSLYDGQNALSNSTVTDTADIFINGSYQV